MPTPEEIKAEELKAEELKTEEAKVAAQKDPKTETYSVKIDGEDRDLSLVELKELASKSAGADKRFSDAAEASKTA
ncbi:hypothetical protein LCGC14_2228090, partial [marine sediment metagenome]